MKRTSLLATLSLAMTLNLFPLFSSSAQAETANIPVPKAVLSTAFDTALTSTKVRLHKDEGYILLPNGQKKPIDTISNPVHVHHFSGIKRRLEYSLNDMSTSSIRAAVVNNRIHVDLFFENQGEEIKAKCIRKLAGQWGECLNKRLERDVHLDNTALSLSVLPAAYNGSIAFASPTVKLKTDVRIANKVCNTAVPPFNQICNAIEKKIKGQMTSQVETAVKSSFNTEKVKQEIADAVRNAPGVRRLIDPAWKVMKVTSQGDNFIITVERPDQINNSSVKSLSLVSAKQQITSACPTKIKFDATIKMKHTLSGTGYLTYEGFHRSDTFNWNAKEGETVTSTVTRTFEGKPNTTHNASAVMKLQWKDKDGKTYQATSNKVAYVVKCTQSSLSGRPPKGNQ